MEIMFTKMEGLGNDFIFIDDRTRSVESVISYEDLAVRLCHRRFGIGGDGIIVINDSETCDMRFRIFNSDGSEAQMCGNGMRCFAKYAVETGIMDKTEFDVETLAGTIIPKVNLDSDGRIESIRVDMGEPVLDPASIPFDKRTADPFTDTVETPVGSHVITPVSMGNPHAVIFVDSVDEAPVMSAGPLIEVHSRFPEKTNVEFIEVVSRTELKMKVWERGAGVTLACGTGACAAVVAAVLNDKTDRAVTVHLDGGSVFIEWDQESNHVFKTGPATTVFEGRTTISKKHSR